MKRPAVMVLAALALLAVFADFLASDLPVAVRIQGITYFAPCVFQPHALATENNVTLIASLGPGDWIALPPVPWGPQQPDTAAFPLAPPSRRHLLGIDGLGLDVASRLIHGARLSIAIGLVAAILSLLVGTALGALGGYFRGWIDVVISRVAEVVLVFPIIFLLLAILGVMERPSIFAVVVALGLTRWVDVQRLVRAETLRLRELDFVLASRALGATPWRIVARHILPNAAGPVLVAGVFTMAGSILLEASLSFLGLGASPPAASWGAMLAEGYRHAADGAWWLTLFPGLALFATVAALHGVAENLRDRLDPRLRELR